MRHLYKRKLLNQKTMLLKLIKNVQRGKRKERKRKKTDNKTNKANEKKPEIKIAHRVSQ